MNIFIFRRDYRLHDNVGLTMALQKYDNIIPIFIGTPEQLTGVNKYRSDHSIQFLYESLCELSAELIKFNSRLHCFYGKNIDILKKIHKEVTIESIHYNKDYTPYAMKRDTEIKTFCESNKIKCHEYQDYLLAEPGKILTQSGTPYKVYGQFQKQLVKNNIPKAKKLSNALIKKLGKFNNSKVLDCSFLKKYYKEKEVEIRGGRKLGLTILKQLSDFNQYGSNRNELTYSTTQLSAYIKFGCVSIREVYWKIRAKIKNVNSRTNLINQLIWRDFYFHIIYHFPKNIGGNFREKFNKFKWINNRSWFKAWCEGRTGFPIVDAGMRELNETGYMHNRSRLITSNFLTRILACDWRWGEKYYAQKLRDYDPSVNNGNWQWSAGTGTDTAPFSQRIFNPWLQSDKFDPSCEYIKKWIPELKDLPNEDLHKWEDKYKEHDLSKIGYNKPIVNYKEQREEVKRIYKLL